MLLLFSIRVAECPPVWEGADRSVRCECLSSKFISLYVCVVPF